MDNLGSNGNYTSKTTHAKAKADAAEQAAQASNSESSIARLVAKELSPSFYQPGPEYLKKRVLQEVVEGSENTDTVMHEPLLAEEEPLPTPPESPLMNELDSLMPGSSPGRTPSPSPGIILKEDPKLLSPGNWNETSKGGGSRGGSKPNSRPNSRPATPSGSLSAPASAAPDGGGGGPSSRGPSRTPSRQSNKNEQGSDLEIKPLQKYDSEAKAPDVAAPVRNSLISHDEEEAPRPKAPKAVAPDPKTAELKPQRTPSAHERAPPTSENHVETREASRPSSKAETKPIPKWQPSPALSPKYAPNLEPKTLTKHAEAKASFIKPAQKVDPKAEARLKTLVPSPISEVTAESLELEGPNTIMICMVILLNIGLAILFVHILS